MECNNKLNNDIEMNNDSEGPGLSYKTVQEQAIHISMVADSSNNTLNKYITIKCPTMSSSYVQTEHSILGSSHGNDTVINIQLPYNPNTPTEPDLWDGNFHPILLHGSMEHLVFDSKNIKDSLNFIAQINKLIPQSSMILRISMVWIKQFGTSYLLSIRLIRTYSMLTKILILLNRKYQQNSL